MPYTSVTKNSQSASWSEQCRCGKLLDYWFGVFLGLELCYHNCYPGIMGTAGSLVIVIAARSLLIGYLEKRKEDNWPWVVFKWCYYWFVFIDWQYPTRGSVQEIKLQLYQQLQIRGIFSDHCVGFSGTRMNGFNWSFSLPGLRKTLHPKRRKGEPRQEPHQCFLIFI